MVLARRIISMSGGNVYAADPLGMLRPQFACCERGAALAWLGRTSLALRSGAMRMMPKPNTDWSCMPVLNVGVTKPITGFARRKPLRQQEACQNQDLKKLPCLHAKGFGHEAQAMH
jgi:hypothetical protein